MLRQTALCGIALTLLAAGAHGDVVERTFDVTPGGRLILDTDRGSLDVVSTDAGAVKVRVEREARAGGDEDDHQVAFEQRGEEILVRGETRRDGLWGWRSSRVRVHYAIEVPRRFDLDLETAGGDVRVGGLEGEIRLHTSGGDIELGTIAGPVAATTSGGDIRLDGAAQFAELKTSGGDIEIGPVEGRVAAHTSGGDIRIERARGTVTATTSGGDIEIREVFGAVEAKSSGGDAVVRIAEQPASDCRVSTSGGDVVVRLAAGVAATIDAATSGGGVTVDLPVTVQGEIGRGRLEGHLNGGGPLLYLRTSGGDIEIGTLP